MVRPSARRWPPALIAVGLLTATGCSPSPEPTAGLQRDGDGFAVLAPLCSWDQVASVTVATTRTGLREEWTITPGSREDRTDRFPLFVTPPGWSATATGLTALSRDRTYLLSAADIVMDFTPADLDKLKGDEVLTIKGVGTTRVKPDKFRARALKSC